MNPRIGPKTLGCALTAAFCLPPLFGQVVPSDDSWASGARLQAPLEIELRGGPDIRDDAGLSKIWGFSVGPASSDGFITLLLQNPKARAGIARTASPTLRLELASEGRLLEALDLMPQAVKDDFILGLPDTAWNALRPEAIGAVLARLSPRLEETAIATGIPDSAWTKMTEADVQRLFYRSDGVNLSEAARRSAHAKWVRLQNP